MILGLTGHIASGKSTVSKILAQKGALVVDADQLAREVVMPGSQLLVALKKRFGSLVVTPDGALDRSALGKIVFSDAKALQALNALMHPAIRQLACQRLDEAKKVSGVDLIVYDAALLFEVGADVLVDRVLLVVVDRDIQLRRLMARNGFDRDVALQRIDAQQGLADKLRKADYVIDNSGSLAELGAQLDKLWPQLTNSSPRIKTPGSV